WGAWASGCRPASSARPAPRAWWRWPARFACGSRCRPTPARARRSRWRCGRRTSRSTPACRRPAATGAPSCRPPWRRSRSSAASPTVRSAWRTGRACASRARLSTASAPASARGGASTAGTPRSVPREPARPAVHSSRGARPMTAGAGITGREHWTHKNGLRLFLWEKFAGTPEGQRGTILFVHGSSMAAPPTFDLQVPGRPDSSAMDHFARLGYDTWCVDHEGYGRSDKSRDINADIATGADDLVAATDYIRRTRGAEALLAYGISSGALR